MGVGASPVGLLTPLYVVSLNFHIFPFDQDLSMKTLLIRSPVFCV